MNTTTQEAARQADAAQADAPDTMAFGKTWTRDSGTESEADTLHEVLMVKTASSDGGLPARYDAELMGIAVSDVEIEQNEDGTWGEERTTARQACEALATELMQEAVVLRQGYE